MKPHTDQKEKVCARLFVRGKVQGVGYRNFCFRQANALGLHGAVRNLDDGRVALEVEGERERIERFIERLRQGPPRSAVKEISVVWEDASLHADGFSIDY